MTLRMWLPLCALLAGCRHAPPPVMAVSLGGGADAFPVVAPSYSLPLPVFRPRQVDSKWLFGDELFPPGATRIFPTPRVTPQLNQTPQVKYPSMEVLPSPDGALTIFSDSGESKNVMVHWLM